MPLTSDRFHPATSGRADPDRYLILGFDTEYQRYVDQTEQRPEFERLNEASNNKDGRGGTHRYHHV